MIPVVKDMLFCYLAHMLSRHCHVTDIMSKIRMKEHLEQLSMKFEDVAILKKNKQTKIQMGLIFKI